ncbi:carbohydrate ABC transporter permease [Streptomyces sp. NPDC001984]
MLIPLFLVARQLGLLDSYAGLIIPGIFNAFGIFVLRQFYLGLLKEPAEAAIVDGCGHWRVYWNIVVPISRPILSALAIFFFLANWNAFVWPLVATNDQHLTVIQHRLVPDAVHLQLELHPGGGDRGRAAHAGAPFRLPAPARGVGQDVRHQVTQP